MTCTGPPHAALEGLHVNTVLVMGRAMALAGQPPDMLVSSPTRGQYFTDRRSVPSLALVKLLNDQHAPTAPGLLIPAGDPVTFTFRVVNAGRTRLSAIELVDDRLGAIVCPRPPSDLVSRCSAPSRPSPRSRAPM